MGATTEEDAAPLALPLALEALAVGTAATIPLLDDETDIESDATGAALLPAAATAVVDGAAALIEVALAAEGAEGAEAAGAVGAPPAQPAWSLRTASKQEQALVMRLAGK